MSSVQVEGLQCCISHVGSLCTTLPLQVEGTPVVYLSISGATAGTAGDSCLSANRQLAPDCNKWQEFCLLGFLPSFAQMDKVLITVTEVFRNVGVDQA